ncbi:MAG: isoleucine--tRNA ligase [Chloroflexota bacterium]|nr:isoleucine--tRNA ligase [Chloroflexota bacterium]
MFKPVSSRVNFPELDANILRLWHDKDVFRRTDSERPNAPLFMMYEGPPTANGSPGIHHALSRVFKDVICRYQTMKGFRVQRKGGWDTHGLPVELEIEKELGLKSKKEIEDYGIEAFNEKCKESVFRYVKEWETMTSRIGYWVDMDDPYVTLHNNYIESGWWILKTLWDKDLLYQTMRGTPHCPRCVTSLSSHEVALGYRENTPDPSVFIKFKIDPSASRDKTKLVEKLGAENGDVFLLAWTTTPWTLPGNTGLAVAEDANYDIVELEDEYGSNHRLVLAQALVPANIKQEYKVISTVKGSELVGLGYIPLYHPIKHGSVVRQFVQRPGPGDVTITELVESNEFAPKVISAEFVSLDDGTGIVHIAPAFGDEDLGVGREKELAFVQPVDLQGIITGNYPFAGKFVKDADQEVIRNLTERGLLFHHEIYRHTYPFCWRCDTPLLYYAKSSWYIRTSALKDRLVEGNGKINWYPEYIKEGRFGEWLRNNVDWAISRERYWGTPIPIWQCGDCSNSACIGGVEELQQMSRVGGNTDLSDLDLHRPYVDDIILNCTVETCSGEMRRVPEVMDAWFDSGAMPFAQWHYPFDNDSIETDGRLPADYICEAVDQTRGWFYSLHALSTLITGQPSYKNVICLGLILDEKGRKMSKRVGNVVEPISVLEEHGADSLRWYLFTASHPGEPRRFSGKLVSETLRKVMLTLWNVYSFFIGYAEIDKFDPTKKPDDWRPENELDRWVLSELNALIAQVDKNMEEYDPTNAGRRIQEFIDQLSNWYVRRSRRRFWKNEGDSDKEAGYITLHTCLVTVSKLMAPLAPFVAEDMYQNLVCSVDDSAPDSIHLSDFPVADKSLIDPPLMEATQLAMKVSSMGRAARSNEKIKVRQPLNAVKVLVRSDSEKDLLEPMIPQLIDELNVKSVTINTALGSDDLEFWNWELSPNKATLGKKHGADGQLVADALSSMDPRGMFKSFLENGWVEMANPRDSSQILHIDQEDVEIVKTAKESSYAGVQEGPYVVAIETVLTPKLAEEGLAREVVHRIQGMRRSADFDVIDRIVTYYQGPPEFSDVMRGAFSDYIRDETLSTELVSGSPDTNIATETIKVEGMEITLGVQRV